MSLPVATNSCYPFLIDTSRPLLPPHFSRDHHRVAGHPGPARSARHAAKTHSLPLLSLAALADQLWPVPSRERQQSDSSFARTAGRLQNGDRREQGRTVVLFDGRGDGGRVAGGDAVEGEDRGPMRYLMRSLSFLLLVLAISSPLQAATPRPDIPTANPLGQNRLVVFEAFMRST